MFRTFWHFNHVCTFSVKFQWTLRLNWQLTQKIDFLMYISHFLHCFHRFFLTKNTLKCWNSCDHFRLEICPPWKLLRKLSTVCWLARKLYIIHPLDQSKVWNSVHVVYKREVCSFFVRRTYSTIPLWLKICKIRP